MNIGYIVVNIIEGGGWGDEAMRHKRRGRWCI